MEKVVHLVRVYGHNTQTRQVSNRTACGRMIRKQPHTVANLEFTDTQTGTTCSQCKQTVYYKSLTK